VIDPEKVSADLHVSSGGVSSLPGSHHPMPEGTMCDDHPDKPAVRRVQGETDSFGCEYICMCQSCYDTYTSYRSSLNGAHHVGKCSCGNQETPLFAKRDYDEGLSGPVYYVCSSCRDAWNKRLAEELEEELKHSRKDYFDFDDYFDSTY